MNIAHSSSIFAKNDFFDILRIWGKSKNLSLNETIESSLSQLGELYKEKMKDTPYLGDDYNRNPIYSIKPETLKTVEICYSLIDPAGNYNNLVYPFRIAIGQYPFFVHYLLHSEENREKRTRFAKEFFDLDFRFSRIVGLLKS